MQAGCPAEYSRGVRRLRFSPAWRGSPAGGLRRVHLVDDGLALLAHELLDVVKATARLARRGRALPATERLDTRPRPGGRSGAPVDVDDARLDLVEEAVDLGAVLRIETGGQPQDRVVGQAQRFIDRIDR